MENFAQRVRQLRKESGKTQTQMAAVFEISARQYQNYEGGGHYPDGVTWDGPPSGGHGGFCSRRGLVQRDAPPIFFSLLWKRKRAVHGPKEKTA